MDKHPPELRGIRFSTRLSLLFGGLLAISLVIILLAIDQVARTAAVNRIEAELTTTVSTVKELRRQRISKLKQSVRLLAADYGFKAAYATGDEITIQSALENHKSRLPSIDLMMLTDLDGLILANTYDDQLSGQPLPWPEVLDLADESDSGEVTAFVNLDKDIYQLVVTPLYAPDIEAWVISAFRVDTPMAEALAGVTGSDVSFLLHRKNGDTRLISSTLNRVDQAALLKSVLISDINNALFQYQTRRETRIGHFLPLNDADDMQVVAFVERSLDQALAPYRQLSNYVLGIFVLITIILMLIIVRAARRVTRSLSDLSEAAIAVTEGNLDTRVKVERSDEIGLLSSSFNEMVQGLSDKEKMRDLLGKVVSPEIANKLLQDGIKLGGEERVVSVLFCDIQGFTRISESRPAAEVVQALNIFFSEVSDIIEAHHGIIDKYIGDAVMAIFSAPMDDPQHAQHAVRCGVELSQCRDKLDTLLPDGIKSGYQFGIGIHSGNVVAGNIGSANRLNYTVIGDTVNIASRVEAQTREFDASLIVTEATMQRCSDIEFEELATVKLKGREQDVKLYTVAGKSA